MHCSLTNPVRHWIFAGFILCAIFVKGETFVCTEKIEAYDCNDPARLIGYFGPKSALEIEEFVATNKMYRVSFQTPDGTKIQALCHLKALGKDVLKVEDAVKPAPTPKPTEEPAEEPRPRRKLKQDAPPETTPPPIFQSLIAFEPSIWETPSPRFALAQSRFGFKWTSVTDNNTSRSGTKLTFLEHTVYETIARFKDAKLEEIMVLLFGRGDTQQDLSETRFQELLKGIQASMDQWVGSKGVDAAAQSSAVDITRKSWFKAPLRLDLEWSVTRNATDPTAPLDGRKIKFRAEFIRLTATSYDGKQSIAQLTKPNFQGPKTPTVRLSKLKDRIQHEGSGDIYLENIPMVDQGHKGYCVNAAAERVMRYYGLDIDQNEIAKASNTLTEGGTGSDAMVKALKQIGGKFSLVVQPLKDFNTDDFFKEKDVYNTLARKEKKKSIIVPNSGVIDIGEVYSQMDVDLLRQVRFKKTSEKTKFISDAISLIDKGAPALWSVTLGFVPETPKLPQASGGHMRLIIGYNKKTSEIIYTDSWGAGHEFKRMSMDDAFFITQGLYSVLPGTY